jgi:hypothetical protein
MSSQDAFRIINMPDFWQRYADTVSVRSNLWSFSLTFGIIGPPVQHIAQTTVEMFGQVNMPPQVAKAITAMLVSQIADYERQFGKIPDGVPPIPETAPPTGSVM